MVLTKIKPAVILSEHQCFLPCLTRDVNSGGVGMGIGGKSGMPKSISSAATNPAESKRAVVMIFNSIFAVLNQTDRPLLNQLMNFKTEIISFYIVPIFN